MRSQLVVGLGAVPDCVLLGTGQHRDRLRQYADMQLIAEAYDLLRTGLDATPGEIADIFRAWNTGDLDSFLIQITADVLAHTDAETGKPFIDIVADRAEQKGTGRWTVQSALDLGVPITGIAEAAFARSLSGHVDQRHAAQGAYDGLGPRCRPRQGGRRSATSSLRTSATLLHASKIVTNAQGFDHIVAGSQEYDWNIDLGAMATIWRGGCIIRAKFLDRIREAYADRPDLPGLLVAPYFADAIERGIESWRRVLALAIRGAVPTPTFSSSLGIWTPFVARDCRRR
jgi:6-phosphogluconate dehydrogenase